MKNSIGMVSKIISITLIFAVLFSLSSCTRIKERKRIYENINKIEKSSDYAITTNRSRIFATKQIDFIDIIREKISTDGRKIKNDRSAGFTRFDNRIAFSYRYRSESRVLGINNSNNYWAVGTISLDNYAVEIHYLQNKYEKMYLYALSQTYFGLAAEDTDYKKKNENGNIIIKHDFFTLDRADGKLTQVDSQEKLLESIGTPLENYKNPDAFVCDGETYKISNGSDSSTIWDENSNRIVGINDNGYSAIESFDYSDVLAVSPELQEINRILGEGHENDIKGHFFTNGEDLFVGFVTETSLFGTVCNLTCPVIFKTDLSFDSFEYIGCVHPDFMTEFFNNVEIEKIG